MCKSVNVKRGHRTNKMADFLTGFFGGITIFLVYFSWWVVPLLGIIIAKIKWSKYPIDAVIIEKRGDNLVRTNDRVGRWYDKNTGHTTYRLMKMGDTIDVLPFDSVLHYAIKNTNILELLINKLRPTIGSVHLLKYGSKQYKPVKVTSTKKGMLAEDENGNFIAVKEMLDNEGKTMYHENIVPFDVRDHIGVIDFQIIDWDDVNTALNEIENSRLRRLAKFDSWAKLAVPIAIIGVVGVISIVVLYLTYDSQIQFCKAPAAAPAPTTNNPTVPSNQTLNVPVISQLNG